MIADAGLTVRQAIREGGTRYGALGPHTTDLTDDQLLDAMLKDIHGHAPVASSEFFLDILPADAFKGPFTMEDGERVLDDKGKRIV